MNKLAILCILISTATVKGADQYCYECSSKSALCRYSVYDGQYLSRTSCASSCFLRTEGNTIYRGCFDGWLGGIVNHDYVGCRTQEYLGEKVEWCFCKSVSDDKSYDQPCNGASKDALSKMALPYEEAAIPEIQLNAIKDKTLGFELDGNTKYFIPSETKDFKVEDKIKGENMITFDVQYEDPLAEVETEQNEELRDESLNDISVIEYQADDTVQCYACHDSSPYCKLRVTKATYLTIAKCKTKCFIRKEGSKIYRGCFDGWRSSAVVDDYTGCKQQFYLGRLVDWCFCKNNLCNGVSIYELGYSDGPEISNSRTVHHIAYGSVQNKKYSETNLDSENRDKSLHPTQQAALNTVSKTPKQAYQDLPLSGTVIGMCRKHKDGIYADPFDCARFVHCFSGFTYRRHCPEGTIWNDKRKNCDYYYSPGNTCLQRGYKSKGLTVSAHGVVF